MPYSYLRHPEAIYAESFRRVRAATDLCTIGPEAHRLALRLVHACGEPALAADLAYSPGSIFAAEAALAAGAPVYADCEMVAAGISRPLLIRHNQVRCTLHDARTAALAGSLQTTRSAAAVELWETGGALIAIGNAPTALFHLLERIEAGAVRPACILGFCVGFVGAAEAKTALAESGLPFVALMGRRGGSALAAAAVNALARANAPDASAGERPAHPACLAQDPESSVP